jgi:hypothetical protein
MKHLWRSSKHYQSTDAARAEELSHALWRALGLGRASDAVRWRELTFRAWTLLSQTYRQHQAAGKFVFLADEDVDETYPSLIEAVRATRRRQNTGADEPELAIPQPPEAVP